MQKVSLIFVRIKFGESAVTKLAEAADPAVAHARASEISSDLGKLMSMKTESGNTVLQILGVLGVDSVDVAMVDSEVSGLIEQSVAPYNGVIIAH